jgi:trigger factor
MRIRCSGLSESEVLEVVNRVGEVMKFVKLDKSDTERGSVEISLAASSDDVALLLGDFYATLASYLKLEGAFNEEIEAQAVLSLSADHFRELKRDFVVNSLTSEALAQLNIVPVLTPKIHVLEYPDFGSDYAFSLSVTKKPCLTLSSYEPVEIKMEVARVSDELIAERVHQLLDAYTQYEEAEPRPVSRGDCVMIDVTTNKNDSILPRLTGKKILLDTADNSMPKPFVEDVLGMEVGETRVINYSMPRPRALTRNEVDLYASMVTVLSRQAKIRVDLCDEWVQANYPQVSSVEEFYEEIRKDIEYDVYTFNKDVKAHLVNVEIEKRLQGTIPDEFYQASSKRLMDKLEKDLANKGKTLDDYYEKEQINEQESSIQTLIKAGEGLRQGFALEALFDGRAMQFVDGDLENACARLFTSVPYNEEQLKEKGKFHLVESAAKRIRAISWLVDTAVVTDVEDSIAS